MTSPASRDDRGMKPQPHDPRHCDVCATHRTLEDIQGPWIGSHREWLKAHADAGRPVRIKMTVDSALAFEAPTVDPEFVGIVREVTTPDGRVVHLDGVEHRYHVRERDNCVAVVISQPGWAAHTGHDYWYVHTERLEGDRWRHEWTHPGGVPRHVAVRLAAARYDLEAKTRT